MPEVRYTITHLEMTAPYGGAPPPRPAEPLALLAAKEPPAHFFLYLYRTVGGPHHWTDLLTWPEEKLSEWLHAPGKRMTVLHRAGSPAGFYLLDRGEAGRCDLAYFGLTPENTGRAIGPWLLWTAIQEGWSPDFDGAAPGPVERMTVHTNSLDHPAALRLYQRLGFAPVRREEAVREIQTSLTKG